MINIANVINVSVQAPPAGLAPYSINNILCITDEAVVGDIFQVFLSAADVKDAYGSDSKVYAAALSVFSQSPSIVTGGGKFLVLKIVPELSLADALATASSYAYFGGASSVMDHTDEEWLAAAVWAEANRKLLFIGSSSPAALAGPAGLFFQIKDQNLHHARCLYYSDAASLPSFVWSYMSRGMCVNFAATNTTLTMNLKQLLGVPSDLSMTQTLLTQCEAVGADVYVNIANRASVLSYGANEFFDDVYNLDWFVGALQVAGFNFLAQTSTKIPQTEQGMDGLKGAYRNVCQQSVSNAFVAPGLWTSPDTFGNPQDFLRNVGDFGYFIYSQPVASQLPADRALRKAPPIQIAIKYAGAIHSSDVIVYINQ